jgi:hypothetical protein
LAVPTALEKTATELISSRSKLDHIGVLVVTDDGTVAPVVEATTMIPEHDGYFKNYKRHMTGYKDNPIEGSKDVQSPYVTKKAIRLRYPEPEPYASGLLTDNSSQANPSN